MLGKSPAMMKVFDLVQKAACINIPVSISGESGTGKELIAKTIHYNSKNVKGAFISIDVSALSPAQAELELFGCEKGYDERRSAHIGKIEEANNGTLLLKNVNELGFNLQSRMLRFLEQKSVCRLGATESIPVQMRVITSTTEDLKVGVLQKTFREDLYYKLLGLPISIPSLKDRGEDILLLANLFADEFCMQNNLSPKQFSAKAKALLLRYKFPGNVRELRSLIELAAVLSETNVIDAKDINLENQSVIKEVIEKEKTLKEYEHEIVQHYLEKYEGNVLQVAEKLAIGKSTLYRMLKTNFIQQ
jgi:DNA-binding NtrC family response regulator